MDSKPALLRKQENESSGFFCSRSSMRLRENLAKLRHPQTEEFCSLQLPSSLALSVDDIVEAAYPQAEISVLEVLLPTAQSFTEAPSETDHRRDGSCRLQPGERLS